MRAREGRNGSGGERVGRVEHVVERSGPWHTERSSRRLRTAKPLGQSKSDRTLLIHGYPERSVINILCTTD